MKLSRKMADEFIEFAGSECLRKDMEMLKVQCRTPLLKMAGLMLMHISSLSHSSTSSSIISRSLLNL